MAEATDPKEPWMTALYDHYIICESGSAEHDLGVMVQSMLLSDDPKAPHETALAITQYFWDGRADESREYPYFNYEKEGWPHLSDLVEKMIVGLSWFIPFNDTKQDKLIQLIVELYNIPPLEEPIAGMDRFVYPVDQSFYLEMYDQWSGDWTNIFEEIYINKKSDAKEQCSQLVNFTAFLARATAAEISREDDGFGKFATYDVRDCLEDHIPPGAMDYPKILPEGNRRDTSVMMAAQYFILATDVLNRFMVLEGSERARSWGRFKWTFWAGTFGDLARGERGELGADARREAFKAHQKMVALHPEFFSAFEVQRAAGELVL
ncbi:hypothetical protein LOZ58_003439 [Ophidiomyces ophidiicola]|nr:hypothetical protein LOZ66_003289 [Ophidiomyces ophidiicola]KAI1960953.1 hypothetical protein LOZ58_003439 [Ophidiomyces ophidiicola]